MTAEIIAFRVSGSPDPGTPKHFPHKPPANVPPRRKPAPQPAPKKRSREEAQVTFLLRQLAVAVGLDPAQILARGR
jgi:hypothetical protein